MCSIYTLLLSVVCIQSCISVWQEDPTKKNIKYFDPYNKRPRPDWAGDLVVTYEKNTDTNIKWKRVKSVSAIVVPLDPYGREKKAPKDIAGFFPRRSTFHHGQLINRGHVIAMSLGGADKPDNIVPQYSDWQCPGVGAWGNLEQFIRAYTLSKYVWGEYPATYSTLDEYGFVEPKRRVRLTWNMEYDDTFENGKVPIIFKGRYGVSQDDYWEVSFPSTEANNGNPPLRRKQHKKKTVQGTGIVKEVIPKHLLKLGGKYSAFAKEKNNDMQTDETNLKIEIKKRDLTDIEAAKLQALAKREKWWRRGYKWSIIVNQCSGLYKAIRKIQLFVHRFTHRKYVKALTIEEKTRLWDPLDTFVKTIKTKVADVSKYTFSAKPFVDRLTNKIQQLGVVVRKYWLKYYLELTTYPKFVAHPPPNINTIIDENVKKIYDYEQLRASKGPQPMSKPEFQEMQDLRLKIKKIKLKKIKEKITPLTESASAKLLAEIEEQKKRLAYLELKFQNVQKWRYFIQRPKEKLYTAAKSADTAHIAPANKMKIHLIEDFLDDYEQNSVFEEYLLELYDSSVKDKNSETKGYQSGYWFGETSMNGMMIISMVLLMFIIVMACVGFVIGGCCGYVMFTQKKKMFSIL